MLYKQLKSRALEQIDGFDYTLDNVKEAWADARIQYTRDFLAPAPQPQCNEQGMRRQACQGNAALHLLWNSTETEAHISITFRGPKKPIAKLARMTLRRVDKTGRQRTTEWFADYKPGAPTIAYRASKSPGESASFEVTLMEEEGQGQTKVEGRWTECAYGLSLLIPSFQAKDWIPQLLQSLARQSADPRTFEVVFALNGPSDGSRSMIEEWASAPNRPNTTIIETSPASPGRARNEAIRSAKRSTVAFLDADDFLSPGFVQSILERQSEGIVPLSEIWDIDPHGCPDKTSPANLAVTQLRHNSTPVSPTAIAPIGSMSACKALPTFAARCTPFDDGLRNGEDVVFTTSIINRFPKLGYLAPRRSDDCIYMRRKRSGSISRQPTSWEFNITDRVAVINRINQIKSNASPSVVQHTCDNRISSQLTYVAAYLRENPDSRARVMSYLAGAGLSNHHMTKLRHRSASSVAIAYCFPPTQDPSSVVMAKRIYVSDRIWDTVSNDMGAKRQRDPDLATWIQPWLGRHAQLSSPVSFAHPPSIWHFAEAAARTVEGWETEDNKQYKEVYSRSFWMASHFGAALLKMRRPSIKWRAEFSDPHVFDVKGHKRPGDADTEWLRHTGLADLIGADAPEEGATIFEWCERIAFSLADELVFTNDNQLDYMLAHYNDAFRARILERSQVIPQPSPPDWLERQCYTAKSGGPLSVAYYGSYYPNRGLGPFLAALAGLDETSRNQIRLHVYTAQQNQAREEALAYGVDDLVSVRSELPYSRMIASMRRHNLLLATDVHYEAAAENPYLPSKLSDYLIAQIPVLALTDHGSPMSRNDTIAHRISMHDPEAIGVRIREILKSH